MKVAKVLRQRYTIEMLVELSERETMRHRHFLEIVPNTTLSYRLRDLKEARLITSRPTTFPRPIDEYYLTKLGKDTVRWILRTQKELASPAKMKKIEEFQDVKVEMKDFRP